MLRPSNLLVASFAALVLLLAAAQARAQEAAPTAIIVVDGSGSMWGNLGTDKRPKIEMVREALRALLPSLRTDARVGLCLVRASPARQLRRRRSDRAAGA